MAEPERKFRPGALLAALGLIVAFGGGAVALIRVADRQNRARSAQHAREATTVPSAGLDRQPTGAPPPAPAATATTAPTTTTGEGPPIVLKGDGLGAFIFGAAPDQVIAGLTLRWGPPDGDTGWVAPGSTPYGACPGTVVRAVNWRGFAVLFSDGATPRGQAGVRHFFTWEYQVDDPAHPAPDPGGNRPPLKAANGVSVGVTVATLQRAYGSALELFNDPSGGPQFGVVTPDGDLYGGLTDLTANGVVKTIVSGGGCGGD
jgi:hypothetical protein